MASDVRRPDKDEIAREILAYLADHPEAQDTLEGIIQWWLLERKIKQQEFIVKEIIQEFVAKGLVLEKKLKDMHSHYRINCKKKEEIEALLK